jgi:SAM-dependent methyltransferase
LTGLATKARANDLTNIEFQLADMTARGHPDGHFDAVVSVFSIFFVPDMEGLVRELWRMVRPGGKVAVTTWGPRIFEPAYSLWLAAIKQERPDLHSAFNPWDRITDVESVRRLLQDSGVAFARIESDYSCTEQYLVRGTYLRHARELNRDD